MFDFMNNLQGNAISAQAQNSGGGSTGIDFSTGGFGQFGVAPAINPIGGIGGQAGGSGFLGGFLGGNTPGNLQLGLGALQSLGGLWGSYNSNKLAKESIDFQKKAYETNLENSTQSYNTALEDRARTRYATEGRPGEAQAYIDKHSL